jgi:magnesium-transporting ATPase (P-type)
MSAAQLEEELTSHPEMVFARVQPELKQRIVAAFQSIWHPTATFEPPKETPDESFP